jgi:hypothetical protein
VIVVGADAPGLPNCAACRRRSWRLGTAVDRGMRWGTTPIIPVGLALRRIGASSMIAARVACW